jgi:hypothetical protein
MKQRGQTEPIRSKRKVRNVLTSMIGGPSLVGAGIKFKARAILYEFLEF